jgi:hypothetical protein
MKVKVYTDLEELPQGYGCLCEEASHQSFFLSVPWFKNLVNTVLDKKNRIRIYGVEMDDSQIAPVAALITQYGRSLNEVFKPLKLSGLSNYYTSLFGPLIREYQNNLTEIIQELVRGICNDDYRWDIIDLKPLDIDSLTFLKLVESFQWAGMIVQTYFCFGNWYLQVKGRSYKEYFDALPSQLKNTLKRKSKTLEQSGQARFEIITDKTGLELAIEGYQKVYNTSWKVPEPYPLFMPGLIRTCAEMGWLRLGLFYIKDEPVAVQLWIVKGDTASIFKLAYDARFSKLSIGSVLTAILMEYVIDVDKVKEVDYLTGDDLYKRDWMSHRRERWGIMVFNPKTLNGAINIARHVGGRIFKNVLRGACKKLYPVHRD